MAGVAPRGRQTPTRRQREGREGQELVGVTLDDRLHDGEREALVVVNGDVAEADHAPHGRREGRIEAAAALEEIEGIARALWDPEAIAGDEVHPARFTHGWPSRGAAHSTLRQVSEPSALASSLVTIGRVR